MPDATQIRLRGGTTTEHATFTGAAREVTVNTTNNTLVVHDGTTAGGHEVGKGLDLSNFTITETGGALYFAVSGTNVMKIDSSGNIQVTGDVETNATIS
jgi:hypothetical protein